MNDTERQQLINTFAGTFAKTQGQGQDNSWMDNLDQIEHAIDNQSSEDVIDCIRKGLQRFRSNSGIPKHRR